MKSLLFFLSFLTTDCPPTSFFYNGSCYFYLPPKQLDTLNGIGLGDVSVDEGTKTVRMVRLKNMGVNE